MKVLLFIASSLDGGAEKLFVSLANQLQIEGVEVSVVCFEGSLWLKSLDPKVTRFNLGKSEHWYNPRLYWRFWSIIKQVEPDIVHSHGAKASQIVARLNWRGRLLHLATKHNSRKGRIFNRLPHVTGVSGKVVESISGNARIIYNGVTRRQDIVPCHLENLPLRLLAVGRLDPIKGFDLLIKAVAQVNVDISLDIAGDGPHREALEQLIDATQCRQRVRLLGHCEDVAALMPKYHSVVINSHSEGFSLVMVEALFYAKLLLSTPVGAAPELLAPALIYQQHELLDTLVTLPDKYHKLATLYSDFSHDNASQFELSNVAKSYLQHYQGLLESNP